MTNPATFPLPPDAAADLRQLFTSPESLAAELEPSSLEAGLDLARGLSGAHQVGLRLLGRDETWGELSPALPAEGVPAGLVEEVWLQPLQVPLLCAGGDPQRRYGVLALSPAPAPEAAARAARHLSTRLVRDALERARERDGLTGLLCRPQLERSLPSLSARLAAGEDLVVALCDLDGLWRLNASGGVSAGDALLATLAAVARSSVEERGGRAYRYGSDELLLVLPGASLDEAEEACRALQAACGAQAPGQTLSVGLAASAGGVEEAAVLIRRADRALAEAKDQAPGAISRWTPALRRARGTDHLSGVLTGHAGRDLRNVELLLEAVESVSSLGPLAETLSLLVDHCVELTGAERGLLLVQAEGEWSVRVARGRQRAALAAPAGRLDFATSIAERALTSGEPVHEVVDESGGLSPSADALGLRAVLCAPLEGADVPSGVIYVDAREANSFDGPTLSFFGALVSQVQTALRNATLYQRLLDDNQRLRQDAARVSAERGRRSGPLEALPWSYAGIVGRSPVMQTLFTTLRSLEGVTSSVVIEGESGTGKELVARAIHAGSPRAEAACVVLNCAAIPAPLMESELFGHARGAFTGAHADRAGAFERAHGGTLFLDELGELPLEAQAKLLRVLQEGQVRRLGEGELREVDVRTIAATNRDLRAMVDEGSFREDLYFRLAVFRVGLPPLRERRGDLPLLAEAILTELAGAGVPAAGLSSEALAVLSGRQWRGNVRELKNVLERAAVLARGGPIEPAGLEPEAVGRDLPPQLLERSFREAKQLFALHYARAAVARANGSIAQAARSSGITRQTLYRAISDGERVEGSSEREGLPDALD